MSTSTPHPSSPNLHGYLQQHQQQHQQQQMLTWDDKLEDARVEAVMRLFDYIHSQEGWIFHMDEACKAIKMERKKMQALVAVMESLNMVRKVATRMYEWVAVHSPENAMMKEEFDKLNAAVTTEKAAIGQLLKDGFAYVRPRALRQLHPNNTLILLQKVPEHTIMELSVVSTWVDVDPQLTQDISGLQSLKRYRLVLRCATSRLDAHVLHPMADIYLATQTPSTLPTSKLRQTRLRDLFHDTALTATTNDTTMTSPPSKHARFGS